MRFGTRVANEPRHHEPVASDSWLRTPLVSGVPRRAVGFLAHRGAKLRERCDRLTTHDRASLEEGQAEVLLWTKVLIKEIDSLERRVDRIAPVNVLLTQRSRK